MKNLDKKSKSKHSSSPSTVSLFDVLPDALMVVIVTEWMVIIDDLLCLDTAIMNRLLRSKYLSMKKFLSICAVSNEKMFRNLIAWKLSRNYFLKTLTLDFGPTPNPIPHLTDPIWNQCSEVEGICFNMLYEFDGYVSIRPTVRLNLALLLTIFPNLMNLFLGPQNETETRYFNLDIDFSVPEDMFNVISNVENKLDELHLRRCLIQNPAQYKEFQDWVCKYCKQISYIIFENCYGIAPTMVVELMHSLPKLQYLTYEHFHPNADDFDAPLLLHQGEAEHLALTPFRPVEEEVGGETRNTTSDSPAITNSTKSSVVDGTITRSRHSSSKALPPHRKTMPFLEFIFHNIPKPYMDHFCEYLFPSACTALKELTFVYTIFSAYQKSLFHTALRTTAFGITLENIWFEACTGIDDTDIDSVCKNCHRQLKVIRLKEMATITNHSLMSIAAIGELNARQHRPNVLKEITFEELPKLTDEGILHLFCGGLGSEEVSSTDAGGEVSTATAEAASASSIVTEEPTTTTESEKTNKDYWLFKSLQVLCFQNNIGISNSTYRTVLLQPYEQLQTFKLIETTGDQFRRFDETNMILALLTKAHPMFRRSIKILVFCASNPILLRYAKESMQAIHEEMSYCPWNDWESLQQCRLSGIVITEPFLRRILKQSPKLLELILDVAVLPPKSVVTTRTQQRQQQEYEEMANEEEDEELDQRFPPRHEWPDLLNFTIDLESSEEILGFAKKKKIFAKLLPTY
jgi:hypothetical protein